MAFKDKDKNRNYQREYQRRRRSVPEIKLKEKNQRKIWDTENINGIREKNKQYYLLHKERKIEYQKEYQLTHPRVKEKSKIKLLHYKKIQRHQLADEYIVSLIAQYGGNRGIIKQNPCLIAAYRANLILKRKIYGRN